MYKIQFRLGVIDDESQILQQVNHCCDVVEEILDQHHDQNVVYYKLSGVVLTPQDCYNRFHSLNKDPQSQ